MLKHNEENEEDKDRSLQSQQPYRYVPLSDMSAPQFVAPPEAPAAVAAVTAAMTVLEKLDARIAQASPEEQRELLKTRRELIEQADIVTEKSHKRQQERYAFWQKTGFSGIAFVAGVVLETHGMSWVGGLCLGAGLYQIAPEFILKYFGKASQPQAEEPKRKE